MSTTNVLTNKGRTIMIQHDVSSPRPYSRIHQVNGQKEWRSNILNPDVYP